MKRLRIIAIALSLLGAYARRVPPEKWPLPPAGAPEAVKAEEAAPVPPTPPQSWAPAFQLTVNAAWLYVGHCSVPARRCEVTRAPTEGGTVETLASRRSITAFALDAEQLYLLTSRRIETVALDERPRHAPTVLADTGGVPLQLGASGGRVYWSEANPSRLLVFRSEPDDDEEEVTSFDERVDVPMTFAALPDSVLVANGNSDTGALELARIPATGDDGGVRMRMDARGGVPSSIVIAGPTLYWSSMDRAGTSHLWRSPLAFRASTRPEELRAIGLGLGVHDLGLEADYLYFLDASGPARVKVTGGEVERLGAEGSALAVSARGLFVGTLDGGVQRLALPAAR